MSPTISETQGSRIAESTELFISVSSSGKVSGLLNLPDEPAALYVFGHGAGAGMRHRGMQAVADALAEVGVATLRYNFPYKENGRGIPDSKPVLLQTVRAAVETGRDLAQGLPLFAGGRSMGGRMTSMAAAEQPLPEVRGLVFFAFPLHPSGKPGLERAEHLEKVTVPMLFLQGTRDTLAETELMHGVCGKLGAKATLYEVPDADHSFHVPKSTGRTDESVMLDLAKLTRSWVDSHQ